MPDRSGWERRPGFDLNGSGAIVVGAETNAGAAVAEALAEAGADVGIIDVGSVGGQATNLRALESRIVDLGRAAYRGVWNISSSRTFRVGMADLFLRFDTAPRILVTAADAPLAAPIENVDDGEFARVIAVNLGAVFYACRTFLQNLASDTPDGRIICVTNVFGQRGVDGLSAYGAAHGGVHNLVRMLAQECGGRSGMTVNGIATGWMTDTPGRGPDELGANRLMRFVPLRRFGEPNEVGPLAVLLAGEASGYINGQILHVDGGITTHL